MNYSQFLINQGNPCGRYGKGEKAALQLKWDKLWSIIESKSGSTLVKAREA